MGLLGGFLLQWLMRGLTDSQSLFSSQLLRSSLRGIQRTLPAIICLLFIWLYLSFEDSSQQLTTAISTSVANRLILYGLLLITLYGLLRGVLFPQAGLLAGDDAPLGKLRVFSWFFIVFTLLTLFFNQESSGRYSDSAALYLAWFVSLSLAAINLIILLWHIARHLSAGRKKTPNIQV